jgi:hypothetical protein
LIQPRGVEIRGKGVIVGDEVVILKGMLERNPIFEGADEVTEVELPRRTHTA